MKTFQVKLTQLYTYLVEADGPSEAVEVASKKHKTNPTIPAPTMFAVVELKEG